MSRASDGGGGADMIDTDLPGTPAAVHGAADWLRGLADGMDAAVDASVTARSQVAGSWEGESNDRYSARVNAIIAEGDPRAALVRQCGQAVEAYGWELKACREEMRAHRERASAGGLELSGHRILKPTSVPKPADLADDPTPADVEAHTAATKAFQRATEKQALYDTLCVDVRATFDRVDTAVVTHLVPREAEINEVSGLEKLRDQAQGAAEKLGTGADFGAEAFTVRSKDLATLANNAATDLARRRSGNPAVRSGTKAPSASGVKNASKAGTKAGGLLDEAAKFKKWSKILKGLGPLIGVVSGAMALASGESPGEVGVGFVGGLVGGAGAVFLAGALGFSLPALAAGALAAGAGYLAGKGAVWAYKELVPQHIRDSIDQGARDAWNWTKDTAGDVKDAAVDAFDDATDALGSAWKSVFG